MSATDWITAVAALAAVVAAVVAVVQAGQARTARADAQAASVEAAQRAADANTAFARQAEAQERLADVATRVAPWSSPRQVRDGVRAVTNTSGQTIEVRDVEVRPEEATNLVSLDDELPRSYAHGEELQFSVYDRLAVRPKSLVLVWVFDDDLPERETVVAL